MSGATVTVETDEHILTFAAPGGVGIQVETDISGWGETCVLTFGMGSRIHVDKSVFDELNALEADCE